MKWGRKKPLRSPSPCSRPSSISQIFSVSWLSKFKPDCGNFSTRPGKVRPEGNRNSQLMMGSLQRAVHAEGRFHAGEDDPFWRLSFGEDTAEGDKCGEGASKAISSHLNVTNLVVREKTASRFCNNPMSGVRAMKLSAQYMPEVETCEIPRKDHNLRILKNSRASEKRELKLQRPSKWSSEGEIPEFESVNQRKSLHSRKRTKAFSSKLETCKIKAVQDMKKKKKKKEKKKKTRTKMKKKSEDRTVGERVNELENFAVVKWSLDPGRDFRESMAEMIEEKKITRPEELEELLACYLTLNCDEYHHLIIKVFRQLWFDVNQERGIVPELQRECCNCRCHD